MAVTATVKQLSFTGGEWSPTLAGRDDLAKHPTAVKTCKNFIVEYYGGVSNRPGTQFVCSVKYPERTTRLIPFQFSVYQSYHIELGDFYARFITNGAQVVYPIGHPSAGDPVEVVTPYAHADIDRVHFAQEADVMFLAHPEYPTQKLSRLSATNWNWESVPFGSSTGAPTNLASGAVGTSYYYVVTAVNSEEESLQSSAAGSSTQTSTLTWTAVFGADYYNVYKLRNGVYGWIGEAVGTTFTDSTITADLDKRPPVGQSPFTPGQEVASLSANLVPVQAYVDGLTSSGGGWGVVVTNWQGGLPQYGIDTTFGSATPAGAWLSQAGLNTATITITPAAPVAVGGYSIASFTSPEYSPRAWSFEGYNGSTWTTLDTRSNEVGWSASESRTYTCINSTAYQTYRFVITGSNGSLVGSREIELYTATYQATVNYPGSVTLNKQRLVLARTDSNPQTVFGSQPGHLQNFNISRPLQDTDSYEHTLSSNQMNEIQWIAELRSLLIGTSGGEWEMTGANGVITPTSVDASMQSNTGSEPIQPIGVGAALLFVPRGGKGARSIGFKYEIDGYDGEDLATFASHLFRTRGVRAWGYQRNPYSVVWVVCDDGQLLGMTINLQQQVVAWHQHETDGLFESVSVTQGTL